MGELSLFYGTGLDAKPLRTLKNRRMTVKVQAIED